MSIATRSPPAEKGEKKSVEPWLGGKPNASEVYSDLTHTVNPISIQTTTSHYCCLLELATFPILSEVICHNLFLLLLSFSFRSSPVFRVVGFFFHSEHYRLGNTKAQQSCCLSSGRDCAAQLELALHESWVYILCLESGCCQVEKLNSGCHSALENFCHLCEYASPLATKKHKE